MRNLKKLMITVWVLVIAGILGIFVEASGRTYLQYCHGDIENLSCTGGYQNDINSAERKAQQFMEQINGYSVYERTEILSQLTKRLALYHASTSNQYEKVIASFYHDYFRNIRDGNTTTTKVDDIITQLIGTTSNRHSTNRLIGITRSTSTARNVNNGTITTVSAGNRFTTIRGRRVSVRSGDLNLKVIAKNGRYTLDDNDVRLVAELYDRNRRVDTVAANNYGSYWGLTLSDSFDEVDRIKFSLLCEHCRTGRYFDGGLFRNWKVLDTEEYTVTMTRSSRTNRYNDYYNRGRYSNSSDEYDLQMRALSYRYDGNGRDVDVELEVVVRNIGERDNTLERLSYVVELDGRRVSSSRYDVDHRSTRCDDRSIDRNDDRNLAIDEGDQCTLIVELTFDQDDVEDEYLEIEVIADARRDSNTSNNDEAVRFYVD